VVVYPNPLARKMISVLHGYMVASVLVSSLSGASCQPLGNAVHSDWQRTLEELIETPPSVEYVRPFNCTVVMAVGVVEPEETFPKTRPTAEKVPV